MVAKKKTLLRDPDTPISVHIYVYIRRKKKLTEKFCRTGQKKKRSFFNLIFIDRNTVNMRLLVNTTSARTIKSYIHYIHTFTANVLGDDAIRTGEMKRKASVERSD
jgi:hypothetical protein